ncbi:MAG TPA: tetratricopeptide repeat protein [Vicinamibacterales bacterium]|jgi:tetratricopeptide (TPR) repeat protein|nr:tetratricopeptide repeat protein [Vicinamibacterales bacterium]
MLKSFAVAAMLLLAAAGVAAAQSSGAQPADDGGAYYQFVLGLHLETAGDAAGAVAAYQRAEKIDPQSAEIPAALAALYARMNRGADAVAAGERAVKADPVNPEANWILGNLYANMIERPNTSTGDRLAYAQKAIANLERANSNAHPAVPVMLGRLYLANRQFDKAISMLAPVVVEQPDQIEAVALLAEAYEATDRDAEAIALLEKSVEDSPELYSTLAQVYESSGRWRDAAKAYQGAVEDRPQSLPLRSQWATALLNSGDAKRAREVLEEGAAANSRNGRALYLLAEAQRRTRDYVAAEATARKLVALDPKNMSAPLELAQVFRDQHEYQKIVGLLEPIVTTRFRTADATEVADESFRSLCFDLAGAYEQLKQYDKALGVLTQARQLSPKDPMVEIRLARSQVAAGKAGNAVQTLQGAAKKFPDEPGVKVELASALERQKKYSDAEAIFRQMIAADPKNADALNSLGYMLADRGERLDESVSFVERALVLDPGNPAYLDSLGWAYYKQGKLDAAEPPLREASEKLPAVSVIQSHFGDLLFKRGDGQEAIDAWQRALDGDGDSITRADLEDKIKAARQKIGKKK